MRTTTRNWSQFLLAVVLSIPAVSPLLASEEDAPDAEAGERCINSRTIRRTDVVNDSMIVFYMRGTRIYLNVLPKPCKGLADERRFTYGSYTRSLCELDRINVLKDSTFGAYGGKSCKLGRFLPITDEDAADLFNQQDRVPEPKRVDPPPVEEFDIDDPEDKEPQ